MRTAHLLSLLPLLSTALAIPHPLDPFSTHHEPQARGTIAAVERRQRPVMTGDVFGSVNPFESGTFGGAETPTTAGGAGEVVSSAGPTTALTTSALTTSRPAEEEEEPSTAQPSTAAASTSLIAPSDPGASPSPSSSSVSSLASPTASSFAPSTSPTVPPSSLSSTSLPSTPVGPSTITRTISTSRLSGSSLSSATPLPSASSGASNDGEGEKKSGGLSKSALIAIIVVASSVGAIATGWTLFRKWKLRPSGRFDEKMRPIDFSPHAGGVDDDYLEKRLQRSASNASADRQRQALVAELDHTGSGLGHNHVAGVPEHDFTAGAGYAGAGAGGGYGMYQSQAYDDYYSSQMQGGGDVHGYPPMPHGQAYGAGGQYEGYEYPSQDGQEYGHAHAQGHAQGQGQGQGQGYTDLKRGDSVGAYSHPAPSSAGYAYAQAPPQQQQLQQQQQEYAEFPESGNYLGRPTGGAEGP